MWLLTRMAHYILYFHYLDGKHYRDAVCGACA